MLKKFFFLTITFIALISSGCINSETVVKVKPDGSGQIHETILFSKAMLDMMRNMQASMGDSSKSSQGSTLFDKEKLKNEVSKYGEDVIFISAEEYKTDKGEGYKTIYSFKDINKIKLNQNPGNKIDKGDSQKSAEENMFFKMEKGKTSTLKVFMNDPKQKTEKEDVKTTENSSPMDSAATQMMMQQMMKMFDGMRIKIAVDIDGQIVETNATHREKNEITLMDMDFAKLTKDVKAFEKFSKANPKTIAETKDLIKNVEGIKVDMNKELFVKFK